MSSSPAPVAVAPPRAADKEDAKKDDTSPKSRGGKVKTPQSPKEAITKKPAEKSDPAVKSPEKSAEKKLTSDVDKPKTPEKAVSASDKPVMKSDNTVKQTSNPEKGEKVNNVAKTPLTAETKLPVSPKEVKTSETLAASPDSLKPTTNDSKCTDKKATDNDSTGKKVDQSPEKTSDSGIDDTISSLGNKDNNTLTDTSKQVKVDTVKGDKSDVKNVSSEKNSSHIAPSKHKYRLEVWKKLNTMCQLEFNWSCYYRIPYFKGELQATEKLISLDIFKNAKTVKVNLDRAHQTIRLRSIEARKNLIVGCPGLREAVFWHVTPPVEPSNYLNRNASSWAGISHFGTALDFSSAIKADLIIVGSVAVDLNGNRVGKGEGFSDLEYALLKKVGGIADNAPVVTMVHDLQVYDELPEDIFKSYDVRADFIITPTRVIEVKPRRKQPELMWHLLSQRRINRIPIIKNLLDVEKNSDEKNEITLKGDDTDSEEMEEVQKRKKYFLRQTFNSRYSRGYNNDGTYIRRAQDSRRNDFFPRRGRFEWKSDVRGNRRYSGDQLQSYQQRSNLAPQRYRNTWEFSRMPPGRRMTKDRVRVNDPIQDEKITKQRSQRGDKRKRSSRSRNPSSWYWTRWPRLRSKVDFSLKVEGLNANIRVKELKAALFERGVRPRDISWLAKKGIAFLHFSLPKGQTSPEEAVSNPPAILDNLQNLAVKNEMGVEWKVKVLAANGNISANPNLIETQPKVPVAI